MEQNDKPLRLEHKAFDPVLESVLTEVIAQCVAAGAVKRVTDTFVQATRAVVLALFVAANKDEGQWLHYSRSKAQPVPARYNQGITGHTLVKVVDRLQSCGLVEHVIAPRNSGGGCESTVRASIKLLNMLQGADIATVIATPDDESIVLKDSNGKVVDYVDTDDTTRMRTSMWIVNTILCSSEIVLELDHVSIDAVLGCGHRPRYDRVMLHRTFNGDFDSGGRLYGGWWINAPRKLRAYITINGNPTVECDYSNLHLRMLAARVGVPVPDDEDAYGLPGHERCVVKFAFNSLLNANSRRSAISSVRDEMNKRAADSDASCGSCAYKYADAAAVVAAIEHKYPHLVQFFGTGLGLRLHKLDGEACVGVAIRMWHQYQAVVLPVHDSFIVQAQYESQLINVMQEIFMEIYKSNCPVKTEEIVVPEYVKPEQREAYLDLKRQEQEQRRRVAEFKRVYGDVLKTA